MTILIIISIVWIFAAYMQVFLPESGYEKALAVCGAIAGFVAGFLFRCIV